MSMPGRSIYKVFNAEALFIKETLDVFYLSLYVVVLWAMYA